MKEISLKPALLMATLLLVLAATSAGAANIAVVGNYDPHQAQLEQFLTDSGHTVTRNPIAYTGFDAVILVRAEGDASVAEYVRNGGCLITEYTSAEWAAANLLDVDATGLSFVATDVTFTAAGLQSGLASGVSNPYSDGDRTQFFYSFTNLGPGVEALATITGDVTVTVSGPVGAGHALLMGYDWSDQFGGASADSQNLVLNAISTCGAVAAPGGFEPQPADVPALDARGLGILAVLLAGAAIALLRR